jgi:hypothetical protein
MPKENAMRMMLVGFLLLATGCASTKELPSQYRLLVIGGNPSGSLQEPITGETVEVGRQIAIGADTDRAQVIGALSRTPKGILHFKGEVRVSTTSSRIDADVVPGKPIVPRALVSSGSMDLFYLRLENAPPPGRR